MLSSALVDEGSDLGFVKVAVSGVGFFMANGFVSLFQGLPDFGLRLGILPTLPYQLVI